MAAPTRTPRSTWIEAGLRALAAGGPDAVRIEPLAKTLGVTRGGFYWHFADRRALLDAMLDTWERATIDDVIDRVEGQGGDPEAKLRRLFGLASSGVVAVDLAVRDWARREQAVAERLRRIDNRRMDYLRSLFAALCPEARRGRDPLPAVLLADDRQPLHRRRSRRAQPPGRGDAGHNPARAPVIRCP